jgi:glycosyltransferase involved in cell wall biosynthesis
MTSNGKRISVIIPTHNRKETLRKNLLSLLHQSLDPEDYQIIAVDDGSTDGTDGMVCSAFEKELNSRIDYVKQSNKGPCAARNRGIQIAAGDILLFINDDTLSDQHLLELHLRKHLANMEKNVSVLGQVAWSDGCPVTPLMKWLSHGGPLFGFHKIQGQNEVPWHFFVTSNVSLKKEFLSQIGPFDEDFREAHDDTEFAWRANKNGMRLIYCEPALTYHLHPQSLAEVTRKMVLVGEMTHLLIRKHPELMEHFKKSLRQRWVFKLLIDGFGIEFWDKICGKLENRWIIHRLFTEVLRYYYLQGFHYRKLSP